TFAGRHREPAAIRWVILARQGLSGARPWTGKARWYEPRRRIRAAKTKLPTQPAGPSRASRPSAPSLRSGCSRSETTPTFSKKALARQFAHSIDRSWFAWPRLASRAKHGGRTRDRTLDLSRVKGTLSR